MLINVGELKRFQGGVWPIILKGNDVAHKSPKSSRMLVFMLLRFAGSAMISALRWRWRKNMDAKYTLLIQGIAYYQEQNHLILFFILRTEYTVLCKRDAVSS